MRNKINKSHQKISKSLNISGMSQDVDMEHELFMKRLIEILGQ